MADNQKYISLNEALGLETKKEEPIKLEEIKKGLLTLGETKDKLKSIHPDETEDQINSRVTDVTRIEGKNMMLDRIFKIRKKLRGVVQTTALAGAIVFGVKAAKPFDTEYKKEYAQTRTEVSTEGIGSTKSQYSEFDEFEGKSVILYSSAWSKTDDDRYYRTTRIYDVSNKDLLETEEIMNNTNPDKLNEKFEDRGSYAETKENVSQEELAKGPTMSAIVFEKSEDDYIIVRDKLTELANKALCGGYILLGTLGGIALAGYVFPDGELFELKKEEEYEENEDTILLK